MFNKAEKKQINKQLKDIKSGHADVFNLINEINQHGGDKQQVYDLIDQLIAGHEANKKPKVHLRAEPMNYHIFGRKLVDNNAIDDMNAIMRLPYVSGGALMPDGHRVQENHVPVGGVVLSEAILPGVVGNDISCSVLLTITDMQVEDDWFEDHIKSLEYVMREFAYFGQEINPKPIVHEQDFYQEGIPVESALGKRVWNTVQGIARSHFGTSGDGNHFLEIGAVNVKHNGSGFMRSNKRYLAILSHFGSRGVGSTIAKVFTDYANAEHEMPKGMSDAPLDMNTPEGRDYWNLMNWAGVFAEQGHRWLHKWLIQNLADRVQLSFKQDHTIYSKHNFAWETSDGYLHRKGSTPADFGQYGVIPATMGDETRVVVGHGNALSYNSASHGAGRTHSRGRALQEFGKDNTAQYLLDNYRVRLIGGGADEDPRAYKRIEQVMQEQADCVDEIGGFSPKVVRMADPRMPFWKKRKSKK